MIHGTCLARITSYQLLEEVYILPESNDNYNGFMVS
jgi:hypothetical protein